MGGPVKETVLQCVNLWSCWSVNKQNTETWPLPERLLHCKSDLPVDTSKQKTSLPVASIKHLITVQLTHSFVCLLNVFARLRLFQSCPHLVIHTSFSTSQISSIQAVTTSRFTWFDWARHAQSIPQEVCEKLSDITLALTKRCECPDRGNDTGHIRLNDNQRSSSPFIPAWHRITRVCGQVCTRVCEVCVCVRERGKERGKEERRKVWQEAKGTERTIKKEMEMEGKVRRCEVRQRKWEKEGKSGKEEGKID